MTPSEQVRSAMDDCAVAYEKETAPAQRRRLASAALVFAQVAEHLAREIPVTRAIIAYCTDAISLISDDHKRKKIEDLLSRLHHTDVLQKANSQSVRPAAE
jgi:hypothetical protein